jgi:hypothetical protein
MSMLFHHYKQLTECIEQVEQIAVSASAQARICHVKTNHEYFQECTLTIMQCQHVKEFSVVVLENFSFLPHILQRHIERRLLFLKRTLLFAAAAIPSHLTVQTTYLTHVHLYYFSIKPSFAKL